MTIPTGGKLDTSVIGGYQYSQNWVIGMIMCMIICRFPSLNPSLAFAEPSLYRRTGSSRMPGTGLYR